MPAVGLFDEPVPSWTSMIWPELESAAIDGCQPGVYDTGVGKKPSAKSEVNWDCHDRFGVPLATLG